MVINQAAPFGEGVGSLIFLDSYSIFQYYPHRKVP